MWWYWYLFTPIHFSMVFICMTFLMCVRGNVFFLHFSFLFDFLLAKLRGLNFLSKLMPRWKIISDFFRSDRNRPDKKNVHCTEEWCLLCLLLHLTEWCECSECSECRKCDCCSCYKWSRVARSIPLPSIRWVQMWSWKIISCKSCMSNNINCLILWTVSKYFEQSQKFAF